VGVGNSKPTSIASARVSKTSTVSGSTMLSTSPTGSPVAPVGVGFQFKDVVQLRQLILCDGLQLADNTRHASRQTLNLRLALGPDALHCSLFSIKVGTHGLEAFEHRTNPLRKLGAG